MPKSRIMGAGLASSTNTGSRANVRQIQFGDKLQGLPPTRNKRVEFVLRNIQKRSYGENRNHVFCMNQIGGIGAVGSGNRSRTFATTADGVKDCKHIKNWRFNGTRAGYSAILGSSNTDEKKYNAAFNIIYKLADGNDDFNADDYQIVQSNGVPLRGGSGSIYKDDDGKVTVEVDCGEVNATTEPEKYSFYVTRKVDGSSFTKYTLLWTEDPGITNVKFATADAKEWKEDLLKLKESFDTFGAGSDFDFEQGKEGCQ